MRVPLTAAVLALAATACFDPELAEGILCDQSGLCPPGLTCQSDGVCRAGPRPTPDAPPGAAVLQSLILSAPDALDPPFAPGVFDYNLEVSVLVQRLTVLAEPAGDAAVSLDGVELQPLAASEPIDLPMGLTTLTLEVTGPGLDPSTYTIDISRSSEITQDAYVKASNTGQGDQFGRAVAISGDLMAVGALAEDSATVGIGGQDQNDDLNSAGAVYVFARSGTRWAQEVYIKASNTDENDLFGISVALDGDTLAVGATGEDSAASGINGDQTDDSQLSAGAVYVFRRTAPGEWRQEAYIKASNPEQSDLFGAAIALSGDTLVVGAIGEDSSAIGIQGNQSNNDASSAGAVYVFRRSGETWSQEAYIKASNTEPFDSFGASLALRGDLLAVGATGEDSNAVGVGGDQQNNDETSSGAVYLFRRTGTAWGQEAYVKASNTQRSDFFGASVALEGDRLVVGASGEDSAATGVGGNQMSEDASGSGAVYVFARDTGDGTWGQEAYIKASNTGSGDAFGENVAMIGQLLAVSADVEDSASPGINGLENDDNSTNSGAVYLFRPEAGGWRQIAYIKSSHPDSFDNFGYGLTNSASGLALSADTLVAGSPFEDGAGTGLGGDPANNDANTAGAAYVFH